MMPFQGLPSTTFSPTDPASDFETWLLCRVSHSKAQSERRVKREVGRTSGTPTSPHAKIESGAAAGGEKGALTGSVERATYQVGGKGGRSTVPADEYWEETVVKEAVGMSNFLSGLTACCSPSGTLQLNRDAQNARSVKQAGTPSSTVIENHTTEKKVGIGLIFESTKPGNSGLRVSSVPTGGPAHESGQIEVKDELVSVNDHPVEDLDPSKIAPHILGPPGSEVKLVLRSESGKLKTVVLVRRYNMNQQAS